LADVLAGGGAAEVLVAARASGLGDDLQVAAVGGELDNWLELLPVDERWLASVGAAGAKLGKGGIEAPEVLLAVGGTMSMLRVISSAPWTTHAKAPTTM
jgi:hypothetical protein